ncbi:MAG: hypothetical protein H6502_02850 [Candidatus Woesearchaeota archaeon]|nr:MAG: hypothetical protein H6502_02850 [Candidatus Woesearchaeota archaeon]
MGLGRKGFLFTLIALLLASLFTLWFSASFAQPIDHEVEMNRLRVEYLNQFVLSFEDQLQDAIGLSVYESLKYMGYDGLFNEGAYYTPLTFNATLQGCLQVWQSLPTHPDCGPVDYSYPTIVGMLENFTRNELYLDAQVTVHSVNVSFDNFAWEVTVTYRYSLVVDDVVAIIDRSNQTRTFYVSIEGLPDPLLARGVPATPIYRPINKYYTTLWNSSQFVTYFQNRDYIHTVYSPSYFQRFFGNISASPCCGIETVLHQDELNPIMPIANYSQVDYYYINVTEFNCSRLYDVDFLLTGEALQLDANRTARYSLLSASDPRC